VAAKVFASIRASANAAKRSVPETFVIFGAVHQWPGESAVYARGAWATPLGNIAIDEELAARILGGSEGLATDNSAAHDGEHAIEVQLPFVKYLFPQAKIVPIAVRPDEKAVKLGERVGRIVKKDSRPVAIMGSTDLTHYGDVYRFAPQGYGGAARRWQKENDRRILDLAEHMKASEIVPEARRHQNACGPGAMAATVAAAVALGAERGYLLEYTTSFDVAPEPEFRMAVGYAGILY
jgi:AmmeMemoRadiSam system protein B